MSLANRTIAAGPSPPALAAGLARGVIYAFVACSAVLGVSMVSDLVSLALQSRSESLWTHLGSDLPLQLALSNTIGLFVISTGIQVVLASLVTLYVQRAPVIVLCLLVLPFCVGVVPPAYGFAAFLSSATGPFELGFLGKAWGSWLTIALIDTWQWGGLLLVVCLIQLGNLPKTAFEQCKLEGIPRLKQWRYLVLPMLVRPMLLYALLRFFDWLRKSDAIMPIFGSGGPGEAVFTLGIYLRQLYFSSRADASDGSDSVSYAAILALLQLIVLAIALTALLPAHVCKKIFESNTNVVRPVTSDAQRLGLGAGCTLFIVVMCAALPLLWLLSLSLQGDISSQSRYALVPASPSVGAYWKAWAEGAHSSSAGNSFFDSGVFLSAILGLASIGPLAVALAVIFLSKTEQLSSREQTLLLRVLLGLFLLPPMTIYAGVATLNDWMNADISPLLVGLVTNMIGNTAFALIVCLTIVNSTPRAYYEQLILEGSTRFHAFHFACARQNLVGLLFAWVLLFSACWNEFYVVGLFYGPYPTKPFAVALQFSIEQDRVFFDRLAAGALVSLLASVLLPLLLIGLVASIWKVPATLTARKQTGAADV